MTLLTFPKNFVWGTATASYQIEGYPLADGAGPSIWHRFSHTPENVRGGHNGDLACEHYRRYPDDIALIKSLGIPGYRMSTAWPRVLPEGRGRSNEAGLDFYDRLIDALLEADITPYVTLYHWDLPRDLQDMDGWANPAIADWFTEYGYDVRFGVTHVDYKTQKRTVKRSGQWYAYAIGRNGVTDR